MRNRPRLKRSGTAMGEMVLVLPLLMLILALLIFFGRGVVRGQHAQVMDRYEAWRSVSAAPGPAAQGATDNPQLNQLFFGANAESIEYDLSSYFPGLAGDELTRAAAAVNAPNEYHLSELVETSLRYNDRGRTVTFNTQHANRRRVWERFDQPTRHRHTRLGNDWAHVNGWNADADQQGLGGTANWRRTGPYGPNVLPPLRDIFYPDFDADLANVGNPLADAIRGLYLSRPGYAGPTVTP